MASSPEFLREHGGISPEGRAAGVLDLSVCISPFEVPRAVQVAIQQADLRSYPDPLNGAGRQALAVFCGTRPERVVLGNGAAELLWTLARVCVIGKRVLVWRPSFCEFEAAARACGASVDYSEELPGIERCEAPRTSEPTPRASIELFHRALKQAAARGTPYAAAYLCAPSSPLGRYLAAEDYARLASEFRATTFIVDQSYLGLSRHADELTDHRSPVPDNLVRVRSLTKELGTPGLRMGYALMAPELVEAVLAARPSWTVSAAAEAASVAYTACLDVLGKRRQEWLELANQLQRELCARGLRVLVSDTIYCCAEVPPGWNTAKALKAALELQAVAVRDCASFGLPKHFRVAAHPEQTRLLAALDRVAAPRGSEL